MSPHVEFRDRLRALAPYRLPVLLGIAVALPISIAWSYLFRPVRLIDPDTKAVYVSERCGYSRGVVASVSALRAPGKLVLLPVDLETTRWRQDVCDFTIDQLQDDGAWWLAAAPRPLLCTWLAEDSVRWWYDHGEQITPLWTLDGRIVARGTNRDQLAKLAIPGLLERLEDGS